jgi:26S proteasome regulatory subunit N1
MNDKNLFSDILSVLSMTYADEGDRACLKYRLHGTAEEDFGSWGHEYVRHLAGEISQEYEARAGTDQSTDDILDLALNIVPFFLKHNGEADAVDLLLELEAVDQLPRFVDKDTYERVCLYMVG